MVVVEGGECPTPCKKGGGIVRGGGVSGEYVRRVYVQGKCPDPRYVNPAIPEFRWVWRHSPPTSITFVCVRVLCVRRQTVAAQLTAQSRTADDKSNLLLTTRKAFDAVRSRIRLPRCEEGSTGGRQRKSIDLNGVPSGHWLAVAGRRPASARPGPRAERAGR